MSPRKTIFLVAIIIAIISIALGWYAIKAYTSKNKTPLVGGRIDMWIVGENSAGYDEIIARFKQVRPQFANTDIVITKFLSQADYEKNLISAFSDNRGPDILMVPSVGWEYLENKVTAIPPDAVNVGELSKTYNPTILENLTISWNGLDAEWKTIVILALKGIAMGYESLGLYFNSNLMPKPPTTLWELETAARNGSEEAFPLGLILSPSTPQINEILTQSFVSAWINSFSGLTSANASQAIKRFEVFEKSQLLVPTSPLSDNSFSPPSDFVEEWYQGDTGNSSENGSSNHQNTWLSLIDTIKSRDPKMNQLTDLFALGKVASLIGTPKLMSEIQFATKRVGANNILTKWNLATAPLPQFGAQDQSVIFYSYLALSRDTDNPSGAVAFLSFLSTPEAQKLYSVWAPMMISTNINIANSQATSNLTTNYPRTWFAAFIPKRAEIVSFNPWLYLEYIMWLSKVLKSNDISWWLSQLVWYINCQRAQLLSQSAFDKICSLDIQE